MTGTVAELGRHPEETYGITVERMTPLEPWAPDGVPRVDLAGGDSWVARTLRVWPSAGRCRAILRWLAAERDTTTLVVERARKALDSKDVSRGRSLGAP